MHPNVFLRTFWRMDLEPQVFVAMSFDPKYSRRYEDVIAPAVRRTKVGDTQLEPVRVDTSKSGDSILTQILDGIAHSQLVLADVSSFGKDSVTGHPYRNGNVLYEVGVALACRQADEVLLIRDDMDRFLFDVSTVPHMFLDFTDAGKAVDLLHAELSARLAERSYVNDARIAMAIAALSSEETRLLLADDRMNVAGVEWVVKRSTPWMAEAVQRLLDKGIARLSKLTQKGNVAYTTTDFGRAVIDHLVALDRMPDPS